MDEKTRKGLIAGGVVATAIAGLLLLRRTPPAPPVYICPYCQLTFATLEELLQHIATHGQPPPEFGRIIAYIKDVETGAKIVNASVSMDGVPDGLSNINGIYSSNYVAFGTHALTVQADNYEPQTVDVDLNAASIQVEILLAPISPPPPPPGDWTEGVTVREVVVTPATLYRGQSVDITVYLNYPTPVPESVHATISVNGVKLSGDFPTVYARVNFAYTPSQIGEYTVVAQDKSAHFTVLQDVTATYYSPFGGKRFPICTKILIPNVNAFGDFPGGDLLWDGFSDFFFNPGVRSGLQYVNSEQQLYEATPAEWDAGSATSSVKSVNLGYVDDILVMAVEYSCQEYWDSKEQLAEMIAGHALYFGTIPTEWIMQYGVTCPTCGGTGYIIDRRGHRRDCRTCGGVGKILMMDLSRGIRDWVKSMKIGTNPPVYVGITYYNYTIQCPYCGRLIERNHEDGRVVLARDLLNHIETSHPNHPLTEPASF
jgi:hypothetical protein